VSRAAASANTIAEAATSTACLATSAPVSPAWPTSPLILELAGFEIAGEAADGGEACAGGY
jgi:hypothetical protein